MAFSPRPTVGLGENSIVVPQAIPRPHPGVSLIAAADAS
jgi:hypothetical protein